ncbi:Peptidoglycan endopeptidase RipB precursor (plasmid) [Tsukamurella tyrosinosolvens]|uniref:NlpC/P60 family protein n=1 Tax=Tsukamurella tyrosinosolvens TaxID=57704 RepID=A0A1H4VIF4_TSUTY|nr:C40 family peptidase [Tsukamurella tyrosinosolvens]KXO90982.1 hypothetical protein AXK58_21360 [Tsukamurella tyrosinosolvens]SEC80134.1 NlpC/P60 family protein [Tsukamurella tyrosinosolvens]VEH90530.1 Peptidoglycan endopeptidase RipB precursor [Tsukamurella tyrosinosolvens]
MTGSISTDDGAVNAGNSGAVAALPPTTGRKTGPGAVDPRLTAAVDDSAGQNKRSGDRVRDRADRGTKDSRGKTEIDRNGSGSVSGVAGKGSEVAKVGGTLISSLGAGASSLLGSVGQAGQGLQMPQVPASTAGQSNPTSLSSPTAQAALAEYLGGGGNGGGVVGSGAGSGIATPGVGGGSGAAGPSSGGSNAYEKKVIDLAGQVVSAGTPYAWGGGSLDGPSQGTTDGGAADAAGDYNKVGYDCSGLTRMLVYQASGVEIPRTSGEQYSFGQLISAAEARPGDLAFDDNPSAHVMMYVGDGKVVEAQQSGTDVMFSDAASRGVTQYVRVVTPPAE